jgi:hypothetical protein
VTVFATRHALSAAECMGVHGSAVCSIPPIPITLKIPVGNEMISEVMDAKALFTTERTEELALSLENRYGSIREAYVAVNQSRSGYIGLAEFTRMFELCNLNKDYCDRVFSYCDKNSNGRISYAEFAESLDRADYPQGTANSMTSPITHRRAERPQGKRSSAPKISYTKPNTPFYAETTSRKEYKSWDIREVYQPILSAPRSVLFPAEESTVVPPAPVATPTTPMWTADVSERPSIRISRSPVLGSGSSKRSPHAAKPIAPTATIRTPLDAEKQASLPASVTPSIREHTLYTGSEFYDISFDLNAAELPRQTALKICEDKGIDPNTIIKIPVSDAIAGEIARAHCGERDMRVAQQEAKWTKLQMQLRDAADVIKRLSDELKSEQDKNKVLDAAAALLPKNIVQQQSRQDNPTPSPPKGREINSVQGGRAPVRQPVKIIINDAGATVSNRNGDIIDGEDISELADLQTHARKYKPDKHKKIEPEKPTPKPAKEHEYKVVFGRSTEVDDAEDNIKVKSNDYKIPRSPNRRPKPSPKLKNSTPKKVASNATVMEKVEHIEKLVKENVKRVLDDSVESEDFTLPENGD